MLTDIDRVCTSSQEQADAVLSLAYKKKSLGSLAKEKESPRESSVPCVEWQGGRVPRLVRENRNLCQEEESW